MCGCKPLLAALVVASVVIAPRTGFAEWFADLYAGAAFTQNADVVSKTSTFLVPAIAFIPCPPPPGVPFCVPDPIPSPPPQEFTTKTTLKDVRVQTSPSFGGRFGHWFESLPYVGLGVDTFHFQPDIRPRSDSFGFIVVSKTDLEVTAVGVDLMLRWPVFTSADFPKGRLQPYVAAGPVVFIATAEEKPEFSQRRSDADVSIGVKVGAGLAWQIHERIALFGEYRFSHFSPDFRFTRSGETTTRAISTDLNTHHLIGGVSLRF